MFIFVGANRHFLQKDDRVLFIEEDTNWNGDGFPPASGLFLTQWGFTSISWFWVDRVEQS